MIGRIKGTLLETKPPLLLIDVGGLAYEVQAPMGTFYRLPAVGGQVMLYTHLIVREDAHILFGFGQERERTLFRHLLKVSGVGPKSALTVLSGIEPDMFVTCVANKDIATLSRLPGIGKKTAERLIIEMRDRLADWQKSNGQMIEPSLMIHENNPVNDAISALVALGYKDQEARKAIMRIENKELSSAELIRLALQNMMKVVS